MNINRRKQLSRLINDLTPEISKRKIFLNFQQSFHFSTNVLIIEQRNKNFLEYFRNSYTFTSELLKRRKKSKCKKNSFDQNVEKRKESNSVRWKKVNLLNRESRHRSQWLFNCIELFPDYHYRYVNLPFGIVPPSLISQTAVFQTLMHAFDLF